MSDRGGAAPRSFISRKSNAPQLSLNRKGRRQIDSGGYTCPRGMDELDWCMPREQPPGPHAPGPAKRIWSQKLEAPDLDDSG